MKILVFGSLNKDLVYQVNHIVRHGETLPTDRVDVNVGGKGLNQAVALSRAGAETFFAGCIGYDGGFLKDFLEQNKVNTDFLRQTDMPNGCAVIQVDTSGQNAILLYGGSNQSITREQIDETLAAFSAGDLVLMQNEISNGCYLLNRAHEAGMKIAVNPSPISEDLPGWPLEAADYLLLNETEAEALTRTGDFNRMLTELGKKFPESNVILTVGEKGAYSLKEGEVLYQPAFRTHAIDTTGAGDTFTGFYLSGVTRGESIQTALLQAACASSIAVGRKGAAQSIPTRQEVLTELSNRQMP